MLSQRWLWHTSHVSTNISRSAMLLNTHGQGSAFFNLDMTVPFLSFSPLLS